MHLNKITFRHSLIWLLHFGHEFIGVDPFEVRQKNKNILSVEAR